MCKRFAIIAVIVISLMMFCILALPAYIMTPKWGYATPSLEMYDALLWIKNNTAAGDKVLAWWDYGYWIEYISLREPIVTPSQESGMVPIVAQYFLSYESPPVPGNAAYIIVVKNTADDYLPAIINWAGYESDYETENTLVKRLYLNKAPVDYHLVFDNGIKVFKYDSQKDNGQ